MNPITTTITHGIVTKIASGVTFLDILQLEGGKKYYWAYRNYGEDAPGIPENIDNPRIPTTTEWTLITDRITTFKSNSQSDVYIYCIGATSSRNGVLLTGIFTGYDLSAAGGYSESFELAISKGLIPGHSFVDKYGENSDIDTGTVPEDIWEYGGTYNYDGDGTAPIISLVSDNALDTQEICVEGLDIDGVDVAQMITLTGTTRVALETPLWRVFRMYNNGDSGEDINGTIYCYTSTGNTPLASEVRAIIDDGNNQTLMALYTIPKGYVGYLYRGELGGSRSQTTGVMQCAYYSRRYGKVFRIKKRVDVTNQGSSIYVDKRSFPDPISSLTDIKLTVENVSASNAGVFGTFDILLVEEGLFSDEYLTKIGQPGY